MDIEINLVNKKLFDGRNMDVPAKVVDVSRVHDDLVGLEEGVNRSQRALNRRVTQNENRQREIEADVNTGFKSLAVRIDTLGEKVDGVDQHLENLKSELDARDRLEFEDGRRSSGAHALLGFHRPHPPLFPPPPPPPNAGVGSSGTGGKPVVRFEINQLEGEDTQEHELNILSDMGSGSPQPGVFSGELASAFQEWSTRFMDYIDVFGSNWNETEKLNRLKLHLGAQTRTIFENLSALEKGSLAAALHNIRLKLDSPHFRELAYKKLAACYQREGESVSEFIKRLVPLVNTTSAQVPPEVKEETLCRCLMEKVRPEYQRSLQLVGPLIGRKDFDKLTAYIQELEVSFERDGPNGNFGIQALGQPSQFPSGKFTTWGPTNYNRTPLGQGSRQREERPRLRSPPPSRGRFNGPGTQSNRKWAPQPDRRWNSRQFCQYCRRVGHEQYNCRDRQREISGPSNRTNTNWNQQSGSSLRNEWQRENRQLRGMIEDLSVQLHEMKMNRNYASAERGNVRVLQPVEPVVMPEPKSAEEKPAQGPAKISSWETKRKSSNSSILSWSALMLLMTLSAVSAINPALIPDKPMICQTQQQGVVWELPEVPACPKINLNTDHTPFIEDRELFLPNSIEFTSKAWACRKLKKNAKKYTSLSGVPIDAKLDPEELELTMDECEQMIKHKSCSLGILRNYENLWQTENKIDLTARFWFVGSFGWKYVSSENCFLFETRVDSHFGASSIVSPLGFAKNCPYEKGNCVLDDKTVLVWEVKDSKRCSFVSIGKKRGKFMGNVWLTDDGELGLTFQNPITQNSCGKNITVSDQGLGSVIVKPKVKLGGKSKRNRREARNSTDGIVTSSQLASQLTYLDSEITVAMNFAFSQTFRSFCELIEDNRRWAEAAFLVSPTELARSVFSNPYLVARKVARTLLKVWPCVPLDKTEVEFRPTKLYDHCFEFLPVTVKTESKERLAFLDPTTMMILHSSRKASCDEFRKLIVQINGEILEVDQVEGKITSVTPGRIKSHELRMNMSGLVPVIESHAFHKLVLLNFTDIKEHAFVSNMVRLSQISYRIHEKDTEILATVSQEWEEVENSMISSVIGDYRKIWLIILSILVLIVSADFCIRMALALAEIYAGNGRLGRLLVGDVAQKAGKNLLSISSPRPQKKSNEEIYLEPTNPQWPPKIRSLRKSAQRGSKRKYAETSFAAVASVVIIVALFLPKAEALPALNISTQNGGIGLPIASPILIQFLFVLIFFLIQYLLVLGHQYAIGEGEFHHPDETDSISHEHDELNFNLPSSSGGMSTADSYQREILESFFRRTFGQNWVSESFDEAYSTLALMLFTDYVLIRVESPCETVNVKALEIVGQRAFVEAKDPDPTTEGFIRLGTNQVELVRLEYHSDTATRSNSIASTSSTSDSIEIDSLHHIGSMGPATRMAVAEVMLNGVPLKCLIDTGSSTSVAPKCLAEYLGTRTFPSEAKLMSASGHPVHVKEAARVSLQLANATADIMVRLFENELSWTMRDYHFILGCDAFALLPPLTFDFRRNQLHIGDAAIFLGKGSNDLLNELRVCADNAIELNPNEQCVVKAKIKSPLPLRHDVLLNGLNSKIEENGISTIPTLCTPSTEGNVSVILMNPTEKLVRIFEGTTLGLAQEVIQTEHNGVFADHKDVAADFELNSLGKTEVEVDPKFKIDFGKCSVGGADLERLKELCEEFSDIFSKSQYDLGTCSAGEHDIVTTTEEPIASRPHRTPFKYRDELQKHIDQLLASGVMVESDTPWVSNIVLVQKKDGGLRPCIDFRKLNEVTVPDHFPLPRLESVMERIGGCKYYTSLDLASGYLQIKLSERASRKCGLITEDKVYQMINLPFGLKNATSAFARIMAHVLTGLENVIAYVDDILIFTKADDFDEHLKAIRSVFERFRRFNLKLSPRKCVFATVRMEFLGHIVSGNGYTPSLGKIEIIQNLKTPSSVKDVRRVVGMAGFFRKHVKNFATIVEPLTQLTRKERAFVWGNEQQTAFEEIKNILSSSPVLSFPDYSKPFHIFCDASLVGQGGALMQWDEEKALFSAVAYCSRTLSNTERKWPPVQVELGAIIYALRQFKPFIFMSSVELHTDHKPLAFLLKKAETHQHLARWLVELQNYNIKIVHVAGKQNSLADALSRIPHEDLSPEELEKVKELEDIAEFPICLALSERPRMVHEKFGLTMSIRSLEGEIQAVDIKKEQEDDPESAILIGFLRTGKFPEDLSEGEKDSFTLIAKDLCVDSGILFFHQKDSKPRLYVPASLRALIFDSFHTTKLGGGHMDFSKTYKKCRKYYWPRMHSDIVTWHKQCITCQLRHSPCPPYRAEMCTPPVNTLFAKVGLDLAGPFPKTQKGNRHILNIVCWFTKFVISVPLPDAKAVTIASAFLKHCYLRFGGCTELISDNATAFTSEFFKNLCSMLYINKTYAIPHWSQGNSVTERSFRTFHNILAKYISKEQPDFDEHLEFANFCYNTSVHHSTNETPFFLMYGRDPIFCVDLILDPRIRDPAVTHDENEVKEKLVKTLRNAWQCADEANKEAQSRAKRYYDRLVRNPTVTVGDRVLLRNYSGKVGTSRKFHLPWRGVFRVIDIVGVHATIVSCNSPQSNPRVVHINQLKKCVEPAGPAITIPELAEEEKEALEEIGAKEIDGLPGYTHREGDRKNSAIDLPKEGVELDKTTENDLGNEISLGANNEIEEKRRGGGRYNLREGRRFRLPSM